MNIGDIRARLYDYIRIADDKKVKAIYNLLEDEITEENEWWKNEALLTAFDKELEDLESGKQKGYSYEEIKSEMAAIIKKVNA